MNRAIQNNAVADLYRRMRSIARHFRAASPSPLDKQVTEILQAKFPGYPIGMGIQHRIEISRIRAEQALGFLRAVYNNINPEIVQSIDTLARAGMKISVTTVAKLLLHNAAAKTKYSTIQLHSPSENLYILEPVQAIAYSMGSDWDDWLEKNLEISVQLRPVNDLRWLIARANTLGQAVRIWPGAREVMPKSYIADLESQKRKSRVPFALPDDIEQVCSAVDALVDRMLLEGGNFSSLNPSAAMVTYSDRA